MEYVRRAGADLFVRAAERLLARLHLQVREREIVFRTCANAIDS
jgi:hypothetical protein